MVYQGLGEVVYKLAKENTNIIMYGVVPAHIVLKYAQKAQRNVYIFVIKEENPFKIAKYLNAINKKRVEGHTYEYDDNNPLKAELQRYFRDRVRTEYPITVDSCKNIVEYFKKMGKVKYFNYEVLGEVIDSAKEVCSRV